MKKAMILVAAIPAALAAACASTDSTAPSQPPAEREFVTGSRIPVRDPSRTVGDVKVIDRDALERAGQTGTGIIGPGGAGVGQ